MSRPRFDIGRLILAVASIALLIGVVFALSFSDRTSAPQPYNGDMLGYDSAETLEQYHSRAAASIEAASEPAYALVTFTEPLTAEQASEVVQPLDRVNALIFGFAAPFAIPEPASGEDRADVFHRAIAHIDAQTDGLAPELIDAAVVYDSGDSLRVVGDSEDVFAVEALPSDAVWGLFGVRAVPVTPGSDVLVAR